MILLPCNINPEFWQTYPEQTEEGCLQAKMLKTSGGFHTKLMEPARAAWAHMGCTGFRVSVLRFRIAGSGV